MITTGDIKKLAQYLTETLKDVFVTKEEFKALDGKIDKLQTSVDGIAASNNTFNQERLANTNRTDKLETWAKPVGNKVGIPFRP